MSNWRVTTDRDEEGFARLVSDTGQAASTELFVSESGRVTRLRVGDVVEGELRGGKLAQVRLVTRADAPQAQVVEVEQCLAALAAAGIDVNREAMQVAAEEGRMDLRQSGEPHPVLGPAVRERLTLLIDWEHQEYPDRQEHPFDDPTLAARFSASTARHLPGFEVEAMTSAVGAVTAYRCGHEVLGTDGDREAFMELYGRLVDLANAGLEQRGAAVRWCPVGAGLFGEDNDFALVPPELAARLARLGVV